MREYKQLRHEERVKLAELRQSHSSLTQIAEVLGRSKSTISRELRQPITSWAVLARYSTSINPRTSQTGM